MDFVIGTGFGRCALWNSKQLPDQSCQQDLALLHRSALRAPGPLRPWLPQDPTSAPNWIPRSNDLHGSAVGVGAAQVGCFRDARPCQGRSEASPLAAGANTGSLPPPPGLTEVQSPSRGSFGHPLYCGAPCKYAGRTKGCREKHQCLSCHVCKWSRKTHGLLGHERLLLEAQEQRLQAYADPSPAISASQPASDALGGSAGVPVLRGPNSVPLSLAVGGPSHDGLALYNMKSELEVNGISHFSLGTTLEHFPMTEMTDSTRVSDDDLYLPYEDVSARGANCGQWLGHEAPNR